MSPFLLTRETSMKNTEINKLEEGQYEFKLEFKPDVPSANGNIIPKDVFEKAIEDYNNKPFRTAALTPPKFKDGTMHPASGDGQMWVDKLKIVENREDGTVVVVGEVKVPEGPFKDITDIALGDFPEFYFSPIFSVRHKASSKEKIVQQIVGFSLIHDVYHTTRTKEEK